MKHTSLSIFSLSALILLGNFPVKAEGITPEIKTVGQLRQETKARNLLVSQETTPLAQAVEVEDIDITVTGTRTPRKLLDTPSSITIIQREDIQLNLITNPRDLLRYEPNISTTADPKVGFRSINIRGIEGNRVLLQVDGIRQPREFDVLGSTLRTGRNFVDVGTLSQIEVLRGGGSALYGSDALGGVVSFRTVDPKDLLDLVGKDDFYEFSVGYDTRNRGFNASGTIAFRSPDKLVEGLLSYTRRDFSELQRNNVPVQFLDTQTGNSNAYLGKLVFHIDEFSSLKLTGEVLNRSTETKFALNNLVEGAFSGLTTGFTSGLRTNRSRISLEYEFNNPNSESFIQLAKLLVYYQTTEVLENTVEFRRPNFLNPNTDRRRDGFNQFIDRIGGVDLQLGSNFKTGDIAHRLTYGAELSWQRNERPRDRVQTILATGVQTKNFIPDNFPSKDFPDSDTFRFGLYLQDEINFGTVSVISGIRFDVYNLRATGDADFFRNGSPPPANFNSTAISPRLGIVWKATPEVSLFTQYSRGFRAPAYDEINSGFANTLFGYRVIPNPNLQAETSDNFEVGVRGQFEQGKFSLVGFYNLYNNFISPNEIVNPGPPLLEFQSLNIQNARIYGIEASGEYRFSPEKHGFSILGSIGWTVGDDTKLNEPLITVDPFKAVAGLRYRAPENMWGADLTAVYVGRARVPETSTIIVPNEYITVDLTGFVKFTKEVTLNLGVFNLFNAKYFEYADLRDSGLNRNNPAQVARSDRYAQPGISFAASLNWRF
jgi:hemoglobin/transferrin/lactoferrin receptor protein